MTAQLNKPPTHWVVVDTSVFIYQLENHLSGQGNTAYQEWVAKGQGAQFTNLVTRAAVLWTHSGLWLPEEFRLWCDREGRPVPPRVSYLWAVDSKYSTGTYWRQSFLTETGFTITYKEGRKPKSDLWGQLFRQVTKAAKQEGGTQLSVTGYEADDIAAAVSRTVTEQHPHDRVSLLTVDTDWLGLLTPQVTWFSTVGYFPQVRNNMESFNLWAKRRSMGQFNHPHELWDYKSEHGDKSDALPAGSPLAVISLVKPPQIYDLTLNGLLPSLGSIDPTPAPAPDRCRQALYILQQSKVEPLGMAWRAVNESPFHRPEFF